MFAALKHHRKLHFIRLELLKELKYATNINYALFNFEMFFGRLKLSLKLKSLHNQTYAISIQATQVQPNGQHGM